MKATYPERKKAEITIKFLYEDDGYANLRIYARYWKRYTENVENLAITACNNIVVDTATTIRLFSKSINRNPPFNETDPYIYYRYFKFNKEHDIMKEIINIVKKLSKGELI